MVAQGHRLRDLQMREAGHDRVDMLFSTINQCGLQCLERGIGRIAGIAHPEPEIGRD